MSERGPGPSTIDCDSGGPRKRLAIVAGYGPVGRMVARQLEQAGFELAIIELNLDTIEKQLDLDKRVVYGDVRDRDTLIKAGIERADALILAVPDEDVALMACRVAREIRPELFIAARTNFMSKGMLCQQAGADYVVVEEVVTAMAMRDAVMRRLVDAEDRA
ncbi:MAG: NAD-binding protein [Phycisphaeraceae bacterium]